MALNLSRRSFLAAAAAATVARPVMSDTLAKDTPAYPPGQFVDIHTHIGRVWNTTKHLSAADLLKWMDANDVSQAVVLPLVSPEAATFPSPTHWVLEETKSHRSRLIPFCCFDPRTSLNGGKKGMEALFKEYVDAGCRGFGEHKVGLPVDDPLSTRLYNLCGEASLPVLLHIDNLRNTDQPGLPGLEAVLKAYPKTTFIGHGPGIWASISGDVKTPTDLGGYAKEKVTPGGALDRLLNQFSNFYLDMSAGSGAGALSRDLKFATDFVVRRQDRLLFGTDYLSPGQEVPQFELLKSIEMPDAVRQKIYRENARKLLKL